MWLSFKEKYERIWTFALFIFCFSVFSSESLPSDDVLCRLLSRPLPSVCFLPCLFYPTMFVPAVEYRSYDSINVSSTWELTSVSMRFSQGDGVHTSLDWLVLYPRSLLVVLAIVILVSLRLCSLLLPSARSCAVWNNNNKYDVCTRTIPAGLKCPPPSKTTSLITWFEA